MLNYILKLDIKYEYKFFGEGCDEILPDPEEQEYEYEQITIDRANNKLTIINKNRRGIIKKEYFSTIAGEELEELGDIIKEDFAQDNTYEVMNMFKEKTETYTMTVEYADVDDDDCIQKTKTFKGNYSRLNLPKKWMDFIDGVKEFIQYMEEKSTSGILLSEGEYNSELLENEFLCCGVVFDVDNAGDEDIYYYKSNEIINFGDTVIVPVSNSETSATVVETFVLDKEDSPMPYDKIKEIIKVVDKQN